MYILWAIPLRYSVFTYFKILGTKFVIENMRSTTTILATTYVALNFENYEIGE